MMSIQSNALSGLVLLMLFTIAGCRFETPMPNVDAAEPSFVAVQVQPRDGASPYTLLVGVTEVTRLHWRELMGADAPSFTGLDNAAVAFVSWYDAAAFANALSEREGLTPCYALGSCTAAPEYARGAPGNWRAHAVGLSCERADVRGPTCEGYRLPTYDEYQTFGPVGALAESRRRAGRFAQLWVDGRRRSPAIVARRMPNEHGVYDTIGNVEEWMESRVPERPDMDDTRRESGHGVWFLEAGTSFLTRWRRHIDPEHVHHELASWGRYDLGFRLVRTASPSGRAP